MTTPAMAKVAFNIADLGGNDVTKVEWLVEVNAENGRIEYDSHGWTYYAGATHVFEKSGEIELPVNVGANPVNCEYKLTPKVTVRNGTRGGDWREPYYFPAPATAVTVNVTELAATSTVPASWLTTATQQLTNAGQSALSSTVAARDAAVAARQAAEAAAQAVEELVITDLGTTDGQTKALIESGSSQTRTALNGAMGDQIDGIRAESPRGGQRLKIDRRPTLTIDQVWPNAIADFRILHADGSTLYAVGTDTTLRKSTDSGATWIKRHYPGGLGHLAEAGLFFKTAAGSIITTYAPFSLGPVKVIRSTDDGATFADVIAAETNVQYLGPTSICQDPITGKIYISEYVTVNAATKATWRIKVSDDDGATWTVFHTFQRDATTYPDAVRHGHSIQWDPIGLRMYFLCGDGEQAAGLYRVNAAGTGIEPAVIRSQLPAGVSAGAVGVMFFPTHIAWGNDQFADSGIIRVARSALSVAPLPSVNPTPAKLPVEITAIVQATSFYTARTKADSSEWLVNVSNENGSGGRLDNALHLYRVADNGATVDEVLTLPASRDDSTFGWFHPVGGRVFWDGPVWWASYSEPSPISPPTSTVMGYQFRGRLAWGGQSLVRPDATVRKPHYQPVTASSGRVQIVDLGSEIFAVTEAPPRATRLYILESSREQIAGSGYALLDACTYTQGALSQTLGTGLVLTAADDTVTRVGHGLAAGTPVRFPALTGGAGISVGHQTYYVVSPTTDTFKVSLSRGGTPVDITTDGTATVAYDPLPVMTILKAEDGTTDMSWSHRSRKAALSEASSPWIMRSAPMSPGARVAFRLRNTVSGPALADVVGSITYAWGF